jgi:SAM-dependent methyltransferase
LWIDDHGWWLGVVEFTPPRAAGSGLYVGAMWLWHDVDHLAFHVDAVRTGPELFRTEDQFTPLALDLGRQAAANVTALREKFPALPDVARYLTSRPVRRGFLWDSFDAGIAAALIGDPEMARAHFERVLREDAFAPWIVEAQEKTPREIHAAVGEIRRVLRPGGVLVYTVRHTGDAHYGAGTAHGDDIYEHGGFAVHFFDRDLVDALADGWTLNEVHAFEEGDLPRRLWRVTQTLPR